MKPVPYKSGNYNDQNSGNLDSSWEFRNHSMNFLFYIKAINIGIPNQEERALQNVSVNLDIY